MVMAEDMSSDMAITNCEDGSTILDVSEEDIEAGGLLKVFYNLLIVTQGLFSLKAGASKLRKHSSRLVRMTCFFLFINMIMIVLGGLGMIGSWGEQIEAKANDLKESDADDETVMKSLLPMVGVIVGAMFMVLLTVCCSSICCCGCIFMYQKYDGSLKTLEALEKCQIQAELPQPQLFAYDPSNAQVTGFVVSESHQMV